MKRFWLLLPILIAALTVWWMSGVANRSPLEIARESWDARSFTNYHVSIRYYDGSLGCTQDLVIEGEEVVSAQQSAGCTLPIEGIEYPTITDWLDYLESEAARFVDEGVCGPNGCACDGPMGVVGRYDSQFGYPRRVDIRPLYEARTNYNSTSCTMIGINWLTIEVVTFIPS